MSESYLIRPARVPDARAIAEVQVRSWQAAYAGLIPSSVLAGLSVDEKEQFWREMLLKGASSTLVLVNPPRIVGWASFRSVRDQADQRIDQCELHGLYLFEAHWGQGLGRWLYQETERCMDHTSAEGVTLWVFEENARARGFYEAVGFRLEEGKRREMVFERVRVDAVVYRKSLNLGLSGTGDLP